MSKIIEYFKQISQIPHCSYEAKELFRFLVDFANQRGYDVQTDSANNILVSKLGAKLCLQAHYDMVCMGKAPQIELIQQDNILRAKESSLGADNGIAIAMMMDLIDSGYELEFLFTSDEEVGLIGASALEFDLQSKYMLNLDSEDENIYIGCAGGFDIEIEIPTKKKPYFGEVFSIKIDTNAGGHSGVDIDKNHPNAIKEVIKKIKENYTLLSIKGGERRNSIPRECEALVISESKLKYPKLITKGKMIINSKKLIKLLKALPHGILGYDKEFQVVNKSVNLAMVTNEKIILSARANSNQLLKELKDELKNFLELVEVKYKIEDEYPAWKPVKSELASSFQQLSNKKLKVIHAGLEPAILGDKFEEMISIGPNIYEPHSLRERVEIASIHKIYQEIEKFLKTL